MSAIGDSISKFVPLVRKKPKIDRRQALAVIPVRNPVIKWECKGSEITLDVPLRDDWLARLIKRLLPKMPGSRHIALDEVGSYVWEQCDGERNINSVVDSVSGNYKLTRREAEASVTMFLQTLAKKNLIGLMSPGGKKSVKGNRK
ncbi:MAG: PqqD family protein [Armatimonadota bacterium]|nr:PqqD family protein [bacterium]